MATASLPQEPDLDQLRKQARDCSAPCGPAIRPRWPGGAGTPTSRSPPVPADRRPVRRSPADTASPVGPDSAATSTSSPPGLEPRQPATESEPLADRFLRLACLTYSDDDRRRRRAAAAQLLAEHPELPDTASRGRRVRRRARVRRHLAGRPGARPARPAGPHGWSPLLYQAYARHDPASSWRPRWRPPGSARRRRRSRTTAGSGTRLPTPFTVLTGVLGYGEHGQPWHPHAIAFARLLLEAGADPNDGQALYNRMFGPTTTTWSCCSSTGSAGIPPARGTGCSASRWSRRPRCCATCSPGRSSTTSAQRVALLAAAWRRRRLPFTECDEPGRAHPDRGRADQRPPRARRPPRRPGRPATSARAADAFVAAVLAGDADAVRRHPSRGRRRVRDESGPGC